MMSNIFQTLGRLNQAQTKVDVLVIVGLSKPVLNALAPLAQLAQHVLVLEPNEMLWAAPLAAQGVDNLVHQADVLAAQAQPSTFFSYNVSNFDGLYKHIDQEDAPLNLKLVDELTVQTVTLADVLNKAACAQHSKRLALLLDIGPEGQAVLNSLPEELTSQLAWVALAPTHLNHLGQEAQGLVLQSIAEEPITFKKWCFYERGRPVFDSAPFEAELVFLRDEKELLEEQLQQRLERLQRLEQELVAAQRSISQLETQREQLAHAQQHLQDQLKVQTAASNANAEHIASELRNVNAQVALVKELFESSTEAPQ
jgi:hypothetical protein